MLSICIPTYNRAEFLRECLNSFVDSARGFEEKIEIIISDNASTDNTPQVVEEFMPSGLELKYRRNHENIGANRNIIAVAEAASGKYVWLFGDDDKVAKDAIPVVISRIMEGFNLIICNFSIWSRDFAFLKQQNGFPWTYDRIITSSEVLLEDFSLQLGYISSVVINRSDLLCVPLDETKRFVACGFPFLYSIYTALNQHCQAAYVANSVVLNRADNSGGFDWYHYFVTGSSVIFEELQLKGYSRRAAIRAKHYVLRRYVIYRIIGEKKMRVKHPKGLFHLMLPHYRQNIFFWYGCFPVLCTPASLLCRVLNFAKAMQRFARIIFFAIPN